MEKKLQDLSKELYMALIRLEKGELHLRDLIVLTDISREVYERLIALRYMAMDKEVKGGVTQSFRLSGVHPGQTSLIDAIQEVVANEKTPDLFANLEEAVLEEDQEEVHEEQVQEEEVHEEVEEQFDESPGANFTLTESPHEELEVEEETVVEEPDQSEEASAEGEEGSEDEIEHEHEELIEQFEESPTNYKVKAEEASLAEKLSRAKIEDLRKAIGLNQKFQFIKEFFSGDADRYNAMIDAINGSSGLEEAMEHVNNEIPQMAERDDEDEVAEIFLDLVERRFL